MRMGSNKFPHRWTFLDQQAERCQDRDARTRSTPATLATLA
jgi:hypothetical protein